ncbi:MAG: hypothetical protein ACLSS9_12990 [Acutalibacteraceae bacterium]
MFDFFGKVVAFSQIVRYNEPVYGRKSAGMENDRFGSVFSALTAVRRGMVTGKDGR